jgi:hypothetical protein
MTLTSEQLKTGIHAYIQTVRAFADTIKELGSVPAGTLYAGVMGRMSLETFEKMIGHLVGAGVVHRDSSHVLTWVAPK